jgi:hypothetical protein
VRGKRGIEMVIKRKTKALILIVNRLAGEVEALVDCIIEINETLEKQNEWLADLANAINGEDEEYKKERDEWRKKLDPK